MDSPFFLRHRLNRFCAARGAQLFGVADIRRLREGFELAAPVRDCFDRALCLGVGLSSAVLDDIVRQPTKLYFHHYRTANMFLDQLAFAASRWIEARGFKALPIPASQITDWEAQRAHLSHKAIGVAAGLGWIGRNNLLVSPRFGAQFRMATVLTDMPLTVDRPSRGQCGTCRACVSVCPASAIQETAADFGHQTCFDKLKSFQRDGIVGQFICGVCVKACGPRKHRA
jgi:epoxyqueuosine reductase